MRLAAGIKKMRMNPKTIIPYSRKKKLLLHDFLIEVGDLVSISENIKKEYGIDIDQNKLNEKVSQDISQGEIE